MSTDLVTYQPANSFLKPSIGVKDALSVYQAKKEFIEGVLKPGVDFGTIPGTGDKPTLLKPGAEKMASFFSLSPKFDDIATTEDWNGLMHDGEPFFYYRVKCILSQHGTVVAEADGSCNSWEKKYRYRAGSRKCPGCGKPTLFRSRGDDATSKAKKQRDAKWEPGWYCWTKKGGCGHQFEFADSRIPQQAPENVPNPDVAEQVNTILKMAQKRALVAAVLIATNTSDNFSQDHDDYSDESYEPPEVTVRVVETQPPLSATEALAAKLKQQNSHHGNATEVNGDTAVKVATNIEAATQTETPPAKEQPKAATTWKDMDIPARVKYCLDSVKKAATIADPVQGLERLAKISSGVKESDVGKEGYTEIMRAINEAEKAFQVDDSEPFPPDGETDDAEQTYIAALALHVNEAKTLERLKELLVHLNEDKDTLSVGVHNNAKAMIEAAMGRFA